MASSTRGKVEVTYIIILILYLNIQMAENILSDGGKLPWKPWCKISEKIKTADCSGHGKNVSEIPNLPHFVQTLNLNNDNFVWIKSETFKPIYRNNISLLALSIKTSRVYHVGDKAFMTLSRLESLDLSNNPKLNISSLKNSFISLKNVHLKTLSFNQMRWTSETLPTEFFKSLSSKNIDLISLAHNKMTFIPSSFLAGLQKLKQIDLSYNHLQKCDKVLIRLNSTETIDLSHNKIADCNIEYLPKPLKLLRLETNGLTDVPSFCSSRYNPFLPALHTLILDDNSISDLTKHSFECIPHLKYLSLSFNNITHFQSKVFSSLRKLEVLALKNMKPKVKRIEEGAFSIPSLKEFYFERNNFNFHSSYIAKRASLGNCSKLEILDLSINYMPKWSEETHFILHGLTSLKKIRLIKVHWKELPNNLFKMIPNIREVDLSQNEITQLNSSLFSNESKIVTLRLNRNHIAQVGPHTFPNVFWRSIKIMDLSGNQFSCDCELLWFRDLLRKSKQMNITFNQYPRQYNCSSPPERKGLGLAYFDLTSEECQKKSELILIIATSGSFVVVGLMVTFTVYKGRWHIRYWIYLLRYKKNGYNRILNEQFKFDGFIIYSDADSDFVHNTLLTKIEKENGYKMCVHFRDFQVGKMIVDNIVESMSQSRQALVVISTKFCLSRWCKFELLLAQDRWLRNEGEPLVIVMLEEVDSRHMTKDLSSLIQTTTYCSWTESEVGQELFWEQLFNSFKRFVE